MLEREAIELSYAENQVDASHSILWRRLDVPGHDAAALFSLDGVWRRSGSAIFAHDREPCRLDYLVLCDSKWQTLSTTVTGWIGCRPVDIEIVADSKRQWRLNGREVPVRAAWLGFPDLELEPLEQAYRRTGPRTYVYQSHGGRFIREIEVEESGFVVRYPGLWEMEARASIPNP